MLAEVHIHMFLQGSRKQAGMMITISPLTLTLQPSDISQLHLPFGSQILTPTAIKKQNTHTTATLDRPTKRRKLAHPPASPSSSNTMASSKSSEILFELPIQGSQDLGVGGSGKIVCTEPKPQIYLLTFTNAPDNRLVSAFCNALILALDIIETRYPRGVVITTSGVAKFYSNGMDIEHSQFTRAYMPDALYALWRRLLTYSLPTVALVNGHAFAGGAMVAMMHDYRVMNPHKGYFCLNELELGMPLRPPMTAIFRMKLSASAVRKMILEAYRFKVSFFLLIVGVE